MDKIWNFTMEFADGSGVYDEDVSQSTIASYYDVPLNVINDEWAAKYYREEWLPGNLFISIENVTEQREWERAAEKELSTHSLHEMMIRFHEELSNLRRI